MCPTHAALQVIDGMTHIASLADAGKALATTTPYASASSAGAKEPIVSEWAKLFFDNFESRRKLFGALLCCRGGDPRTGHPTFVGRQCFSFRHACHWCTVMQATPRLAATTSA